MQANKYNRQTKLLIITGERESGKTSLCKTGITWCRNQGIPVTGIISPGVYCNNIRIAIEALNVEQDCAVTLGIRKGITEQPCSPNELASKLMAPFIETPRWKFSEQAFQHCSTWLRADPHAVFWIDELGKLEFENRQGFFKAFEILRTQQYQSAIAVIRPELIKDIPKFLPELSWQILDITSAHSADQVLCNFIALHRA